MTVDKEIEKEFNELTKNIPRQELDSRLNLNDTVLQAEKSGRKSKSKKGEMKEKNASEKSKPVSPLDFARAAVSQMKGSYAMSEDLADSFICTGHAGLNYLSSGRFWGPEAGIVRRKTIEDYGPSGSMKSAFLYKKIANVQKMGGIGAVIDAEGARNLIFLGMLGVDLEACINLVPLDNKNYECYAIESVFAIAKEFIETLRKGGFEGPIFVGIDSIAVCPLYDEWEQLRDGKDVSEDRGRRAKVIGQFQRCLNGFLRGGDNTLDIINQIRTAMPKPGRFGGPTETTTSGKSLEFYSDFRMDIRKRKSIQRTTFKSKSGASESDGKNDWKGRKLGNFFNATSEKTRATAPYKRIEDIEFYFDHGIAPLSGMFSLCAMDEIIVQTSPGRYMFVDPSSRSSARLKVMDGVPNFTRRNFDEEDWIFDNAPLFKSTRAELENFIKSSMNIHPVSGEPCDPHNASKGLKAAARDKNSGVVIMNDTDETEDEKKLERKSKLEVLAEQGGGKYKQKLDKAEVIEDEVPETEVSSDEFD